MMSGFGFLIGQLQHDTIRNYATICEQVRQISSFISHSLFVFSYPSLPLDKPFIFLLVIILL